MCVHHVLLSHPGMRYHDLGADCYERERAIARQVRRHVASLGRLGYEVTVTHPPEPDGTSQDAQASWPAANPSRRR